MRRREFLWLTALAGRLPAAPDALKGRASTVLRKHLDLLLSENGEVASIKGKDGVALTAMCFEVMHGVTGLEKYRRAAIALADQVLERMKASPTGVLAIKEKGEEKFEGGGPPALGYYTSSLCYVYRQAGGRKQDLLYLAGVLDRFPWNPKGWWANTIDVANGRPGVLEEKPTQVNKNAAVALGCAALCEAVEPLDAEMAGRLRARVEKCLHEQILPAQDRDGYWHYSLSGRDPNNKDVLGYFMLGTGLLIRLQSMAPSFANDALARCIGKAEAYAAKNIAPMTDPYRGTRAAGWTSGTPSHYDVAADPKRGFQLSMLLVDGGFTEQAEKILGTSLEHFPYGERGQTGAKCAHDAAFVVTRS